MDNFSLSDVFLKGDVKSYADNTFAYVDSAVSQSNGMDWLEFPKISKIEDPEEPFQKLKNKIESTSGNMSIDKQNKLRDTIKISVFTQNLINSLKYMAVVEYACMVFGRSNPVLYFKRGSVVYSIGERFWYRQSDLLKSE